MKAANFIDTNAPLYHERFCLSERVLHHLFHVFQKEFLSLTHLTKEQFSTLLQFNLIELSHREDGSVSGWCWRMGSFHDRAFTCICGCRWTVFTNRDIWCFKCTRTYAMIPMTESCLFYCFLAFMCRDFSGFWFFLDDDSKMLFLYQIQNKIFFMQRVLVEPFTFSFFIVNKYGFMTFKNHSVFIFILTASQLLLEFGF